MQPTAGNQETRGPLDMKRQNVIGVDLAKNVILASVVTPVGKE